MPSAFVTRFAPSPTGRLHLGHVLSAFLAHNKARQEKGSFLLRFEDIDISRYRKEYADSIMEDLRWLGFHWEKEVRFQSLHFSDYRACLDYLEQKGLIYPCFCSRSEILKEIQNSASAPHAPDGSILYPGNCRQLCAKERKRLLQTKAPYCLRLDMERSLNCIQGTLCYEEETQGNIVCAPQRFGDVILARKDTPASYHLCAVHDDFFQKVTYVTRGIDLQPASDIHRLLQALFCWPTPLYHHHALVKNEEGRRLSKRDQSTSVATLRSQGMTPQMVLAMARACL